MLVKIFAIKNLKWLRFKLRDNVILMSFGPVCRLRIYLSVVRNNNQCNDNFVLSNDLPGRTWE